MGITDTSATDRLTAHLDRAGLEVTDIAAAADGFRIAVSVMGELVWLESEAAVWELIEVAAAGPGADRVASDKHHYDAWVALYWQIIGEGGIAVTREDEAWVPVCVRRKVGGMPVDDMARQFDMDTYEFEPFVLGFYTAWKRMDDEKRARRLARKAPAA